MTSTAFVPGLLHRARVIAAARGFTPEAWRGLERALRPDGVSARGSAPRREVADDEGPGALGDAYETWLANAVDVRKRRGSYFTPRPVAAEVVNAAWALHPREVRVVLDPSMGGGRFLLEALRHVPWTALHGLDIDPIAVWVARLSVALAVGAGVNAKQLCAQLRHANALHAPLPPSDVIVGNPPWLAHAGRQTVPLAPAVRNDYRARFHAFRGFPTTHGVFVEAAALALRPGGVLALLLPTQVADLDGYAATREALTRRASVIEPLEELGFAQFTAMVGPTVVLCAVQTDTPASSSRPWTLRESRSSRLPTIPRHTTDALAALRDLPRFAPDTFGELGVQTAGDVSTRLFHPWRADDPRTLVPLREGRDVHPFAIDPPRIGLEVDRDVLDRAGVRLRPAGDFQRATVVIRQTARYPIAAVHDPAHAFRNSLLAGFTDRPWLLAALLNSALFRSLHLAAQRDGRQAVFPQVKIAHLRALPAPPPALDVAHVEGLARRAAEQQRGRRDALTNVANALGRSVPRTLFDVTADGVVSVRTPTRTRLLTASTEAFDAAHAALTAASVAYVTLTREIDTLIECAYGVTPP